MIPVDEMKKLLDQIAPNEDNLAGLYIGHSNGFRVEASEEVPFGIPGPVLPSLQGRSCCHKQC